MAGLVERGLGGNDGTDARPLGKKRLQLSSAGIAVQAGQAAQATPAESAVSPSPALTPRITYGNNPGLSPMLLPVPAPAFPRPDVPNSIRRALAASSNRATSACPSAPPPVVPTAPAGWRLNLDALQGRWMHSQAQLGALTVTSHMVKFDNGKEYTVQDGEGGELVMAGWTASRAHSSGNEVKWVRGDLACFWRRDPLHSRLRSHVSGKAR